jgi:hypothetical protein
VIPATGGVLATDSAPAGETLTAKLVSGTSHGTLTLDANGDGGFKYVPKANYVGTDSFVYKAVDSGGQSAEGTVKLTILAPPPVVATPAAGPVSAVAGVNTGPVVLATFTDPAGALALTYYSASIQWHDGSSPSAGAITFDISTQTFTVTGSHAYAKAGVDPAPTITILREGLSTTLGDTSSVAVKGDSITTAGTSLTGEEGRLVTGTIASFTDSKTTAKASQFKATINWGDGSAPTAGTIVSAGNGKFLVTGGHIYEADNQRFAVTVTIANSSGTGGTADSTAFVSAAPLDEAVAAPNFTVKSGTAFSNKVLGTFRDQDSGNTLAGVYSGTIDWGDATSSAARFKFKSATHNVGSFWQVLGSHTYAAKKAYTVTLTFFDTGNVTSFPSTVLTLKITAD